MCLQLVNRTVCVVLAVNVSLRLTEHGVRCILAVNVLIGLTGLMSPQSALYILAVICDFLVSRLGLLYLYVVTGACM